MSQWIVTTENLVKIYKMGKNEVQALAGVSLKVERGEFLSIMGRSGSGKSTLLNMLGCLDRPTSGSVVIDGAEIAKLNSKQLPKVRREKVGFIFQHHNLIPTLTAVENVLLPMKYARVPKTEAQKRAMELLEMIELTDRATHLPTELSGGQQARVAIARALANRPAIILADEPTGELDSQTALKVIELLKELNRTLQQTVLIVTHDPLVAAHTQRTLTMSDGKVLEERQNGPLQQPAMANAGVV